jgi:exopolyphosphatase/guanosine-5'-triphosphate,3'-diphosphate pyrophosphatase
MNAPDERAACLWIPETTYGSNGSAAPVRVCVIDLGTNSFHAIIVDAHPNGSYKVVDRLKEMVRLGQHGLNANRLPDDAMERGLQALQRIKLLADGWGAREYLSFATSAIREATNGGAFIKRVRKEVGLRIRPISGEQEAELIFQGVKRAVDMPNPTLVVDVGGGSVECIVVVGGQPVHATSLKLGAARMTERFVTSDPMSEAEEAAMRAHFRDTMAHMAAVAREHGVQTVVGSSGTMKTLARLGVQRCGDDTRSIFQQSLPVSGTREALQQVMRASIQKRMDHATIDDQRADQIGAGAVLVDTVFDLVPSVERFTVSANALREGMVVHFIRENDLRIQHMASFWDVRRRSVHEIAFRFDWEERHAQHVAATASILFDVCRPLYDGPATDVELIEFAGLLHDLGYHISHAKHQKHSRYLIGNADLQGFQPEEIKILSLAARYHRGSAPSTSHEKFRMLDAPLRRRVEQLAGLLRIAEALDRSHFQNVTALRASLSPSELRIAVETKGDPQLEVWAAGQDGSLFERAFDRRLVVETTSIPVHTNGEPVPASVTHSTP